MPDRMPSTPGPWPGGQASGCRPVWRPWQRCGFRGTDPASGHRSQLLDMGWLRPWEPRPSGHRQLGLPTRIDGHGGDGIGGSHPPGRAASASASPSHAAPLPPAQACVRSGHLPRRAPRRSRTRKMPRQRPLVRGSRPKQPSPASPAVRAIVAERPAFHLLRSGDLCHLKPASGYGRAGDYSDLAQDNALCLRCRALSLIRPNRSGASAS